MNFDLQRSIAILQQTPFTLQQMLGGLSADWTASSDDRENWGPYDVIGHLIHGEKTDWIVRARIILDHGTARPFDKYDRLAQFESSADPSLRDLITDFIQARKQNLEVLVAWDLKPEQLALKGSHPALGEVTLEQLLAAWVVHDLGHIRQIVTYMARRYDEAVGPWKQYLSILQ